MAVERKWNGTEWVVTGSSGISADQTPVALDSLRVFATASVSLDTGNTWYDVPNLEVTLPAAPYDRRVKVTYQAYVYMNITSNAYVDTQILVDGASPNARDQFTIASAESIGRYATNYSHVWLTVPAGVSHTFKVQARTGLTGGNIEISYAGSRTWLEYEVWPTIMAAPGENLLPGSPLVYESRGSSGVNNLPIGTFATSLEIPGARIEMPVKAGDVVFYTFNGWLGNGGSAGDARMGCEPSGVAYTKYTGWTSAQSYLRMAPGGYDTLSLTDWLVADEDGTLVLQLRGYATTGATTPQANYVGIKAWIPKGQKGDTGEKGDKGDPGLMGDLPTTRVSTSTWHITNNTTDYMPISTVERDDLGWVSGDEIIVDADGAYLVSGSVAKTTNNMVRSTLAVAVNGGGSDVAVDQQWAAGGTFRRRSVSGVLLLNAGDRVALRALLNSGSDVADAAGNLSVTKLEGMQGPKGDPGLVNGIQSGVVTCVGTGAATADGVVTFPQPYASTPVIVCTPAANSYASATTAGLSATGFTARIRRVDDSGSFGGNTDVHWMAMGTLA